MLARIASGEFSASQVEERLEDAGQVLLALPWAGCFPAGFQTLWPIQTPSDTPRSPVPSSHEISAMDEAYLWVELLPNQDERRLVLMRSLVREDPVTGRLRYTWSWNRLRQVTGLHPDTLRARWGRGIDHIVRRLNQRGIPARAASSGGQPSAGTAGLSGERRPRSAQDRADDALPSVHAVFGSPAASRKSAAPKRLLLTLV